MHATQNRCLVRRDVEKLLEEPVTAIPQLSWYTTVVCNAETLKICERVMLSWTVTSIGRKIATLSNCDTSKIKAGDELLFIVTRGVLDHFGKYEIMKVTSINGYVLFHKATEALLRVIGIFR